MVSKTTDELLAEVPLFAGLSRKDLKRVSGLATRLELRQGRELTRQGDIGREFIVVLEGTVDVMIDGELVNTCNAGSCFGEIALLSDRRRTATVVAKTDVVVDVIGRQEFSTLLQDHPAIAEQLKAVMAAHLGEDDSR
ncbi:MAG: cyclic nucleotide-binding domain-containing protein [Acidimicrobiales bacterium]|jgi:CRP-like cAMP-binding protein